MVNNYMVIYPNNLAFTVKEHRASSKHYDFRLECKGVFISFAIPKGPTLNPDEKRLAIEVPLHSLKSFNSEGIIPKGRYGSGPFIVWDKGVFYPLGLKDVSKNVQEFVVRDSYLEGRIRFFLNGAKLKGSFELKRIDRDKWLLMKLKDNFISTDDVKKQNKSVISGLTLEELSEGKKLSVKEDSFQMPLFG